MKIIDICFLGAGVPCITSQHVDAITIVYIPVNLKNNKIIIKNIMVYQQNNFEIK